MSAAPQLGPHVVIKHLATGGMGELFLAQRHAAQRSPQHSPQLVVIKRIRAELLDDAQLTASFLEEGRVASLLDHPNVVRVLELAPEEHDYALVMEYVPGVDLSRLLTMVDGPLPLPVTLTVLDQLCAGVAYAHAALGPDGERLELVHRDITPRNVLLSFEGEVKLTDFGIAKAALAHRVQTAAGVIKGNFGYMAPEQARGEQVTQSADIYSLGLLLFEMTTGVQAVDGETDTAKLLASVDGRLRSPEALVPDYPPQLADIYRRATAVAPVQRYANARQLQAELRTFAAQSQVQPDPELLARLLRNHFAEQWAQVQQLTARTAAAPAAPSPPDESAPPPPPVPEAAAAVLEAPSVGPTDALNVELGEELDEEEAANAPTGLHSFDGRSPLVPPPTPNAAEAATDEDRPTDLRPFGQQPGEANAPTALHPFAADAHRDEHAEEAPTDLRPFGREPDAASAPTALHPFPADAPHDEHAEEAPTDIRRWDAPHRADAPRAGGAAATPTPPASLAAGEGEADPIALQDQGVLDLGRLDLADAAMADEEPTLQGPAVSAPPEPSSTTVNSGAGSSASGLLEIPTVVGDSRADDALSQQATRPVAIDWPDVPEAGGQAAPPGETAAAEPVSPPGADEEPTRVTPDSAAQQAGRPAAVALRHDPAHRERWARLEQQLMNELEQQSPASRPRRGLRLALVLLLLGGAGIGLGLYWHAHGRLPWQSAPGAHKRPSAAASAQPPPPDAAPRPADAAHSPTDGPTSSADAGSQRDAGPPDAAAAAAKATPRAATAPTTPSPTGARPAATDRPPGKLRLSTSPRMTVTLEGRSLGRTPLVTTLPAGKHVLTLSNPARKLRLRRSVWIRSNDLTVLRWTFGKRQPQAPTNSGSQPRTKPRNPAFPTWHAD